MLLALGARDTPRLVRDFLWAFNAGIIALVVQGDLDKNEFGDLVSKWCPSLCANVWRGGVYTCCEEASG